MRGRAGDGGGSDSVSRERVPHIGMCEKLLVVGEGLGLATVSVAVSHSCLCLIRMVLEYLESASQVFILTLS